MLNGFWVHPPPPSFSFALFPKSLFAHSKWLLIILDVNETPYNKLHFIAFIHSWLRNNRTVGCNQYLHCAVNLQEIVFYWGASAFTEKAFILLWIWTLIIKQCMQSVTQFLLYSGGWLSWSQNSSRNNRKQLFSCDYKLAIDRTKVVLNSSPCNLHDMLTICDQRYLR